MKKYLLLFFLIVSTIITLSSCSSSNDVDPKSPEGIKSALVGVWKTTMSSSNWRTIYIMPGGKLKYEYITKDKLKNYTYNKETGLYTYEWEDELGETYVYKYDPSPDGYWTFDNNTQSIYMYSNDEYYKYAYKVVMNDDQNSWVGTNNKDRIDTFTRIEE